MVRRFLKNRLQRFGEKNMKIMIASDIHGSAFYCRAMLETYKREQAQRLLLLGDILYHGPRNDLPRDYAPKEVGAMLNERKTDIMCVRGNCDAEVDQMILEFPIMADYAFVPYGKHIVYAAHGHNVNPHNMPPLKEGDILLNGHTHIPAMEQTGGIWYMNPGSVSIPKEDSPHSYLVWDGDTFQWKDLENGQIYREFVYEESI